MDTNRATQLAHGLLRIVSGLLFFQAGSTKLLGWFGHPTTPPLMSQMGIGGVLESFGGLAILVGFLTRPVAFILSGEMAVAYWQFHAPRGAWPIQNHGEPAVLFCFIFLLLAASGAGPFSLDHVLWTRRKAKRP